MAPYPLGSNTTNFSFSFQSSCLKGTWCKWFILPRKGTITLWTVILIGQMMYWMYTWQAALDSEFVIHELLLNIGKLCPFELSQALDITTCKADPHPKKQPWWSHDWIQPPQDLANHYAAWCLWSQKPIPSTHHLRSPIHQPDWWILMSFEESARIKCWISFTNMGGWGTSSFPFANWDWFTKC